MDNLAQQKPCLVSTMQGFSVLYKEKLLYSKYNPSKQILCTIKDLTILPGTIILCCSPVLDYGIEELYNKLPEDCLLLGCEPDPLLNSFIKENSKLLDKFILLNYEEFCNLPEIINKKNFTFNNGKTVEFTGTYKRVLRINFSAGIQFNSELFDQFYSVTSNANKTFWTNRITLAHFGQRYSRNIFANLHKLKNTLPITNYFNAIEKPIIVCGAGQSLNTLYSDITNPKDYFILCADTALKPLLSHNIIPDGVFVDEAQHVISKAFLGTEKHNYHLFASLCSLPQLGDLLPPQRISYYTTIFTQNDFISQLSQNKSFPYATKPFGSVGLTTIDFALKFRKDDSIPVFVYGLDFSYSAGITHANQTLAHQTRLVTTNRINPVQNYNASFQAPAVPVQDKNHSVFYTTPVLNSYAMLFINCFSNCKNLFDSADCGIDLKLQRKKPFSNSGNVFFKEDSYSEEDLKFVDKFLSTERSELIRLKNILSGNTTLSKEDALIEIKKIVQKREYLYLHFPDGFKFSSAQSFLNRVRAQIDYFLKWI